MSFVSYKLQLLRRGWVLRSSRVSEGWWWCFLEQQSNLSLRQEDSPAHIRMDAMDQETIDHYFSLLHDTLVNHDLLNKPAQIYNVDETGIPFNPFPLKIVSTKGKETKKVRNRSSGSKGQITVTCVNAAGQCIPPMVIFNAAKLNPAWTKNEVCGTKYGVNSNAHCKNGGVRETPSCRNMRSCVSTVVLCLHHTIFLTPLNVTTTLPRCQTTAFTEYNYFYKVLK